MVVFMTAIVARTLHPVTTKGLNAALHGVAPTPERQRSAANGAPFNSERGTAGRHRSAVLQCLGPRPCRARLDPWTPYLHPRTVNNPTRTILSDAWRHLGYVEGDGVIPSSLLLRADEVIG
jgi:hypothetical protein